MRGCRLARIGAFALPIMVGASLASSVGDLYFRSYGPKGTLMVRNPVFMWECWADDAKSITSVEAELDGKTVPSHYDPILRRVVAKPEGPLEAGQYQASIKVYYAGGRFHEKTWTLSISDQALLKLPAPNAAQKLAIETANDFRKKMGLEEYSMDDRLNAAGLAHSRYLAANNATGHIEKPGTTGFIGKSHRERLEAFGYVGTAIENVAYGSHTADEAIRALVDAPYHRIAFLQPGKLSFGSGLENQRLTMTCETTEVKAVLCYPYNGQTDVPLAWSQPEKPNPLAIHGLSGKVVGYPIVLAAFGVGRGKIHVNETSLQTDAGEIVTHVVNNPENDEHLDNAMFIIPREPLKANTGYVVKVSFSILGDEVSAEEEKVWRFRTTSK